MQKQAKMSWVNT